MVVGIHAGFLSDISTLAEYLTVNGIFRVAVPVFCIISGFYFYPALTNGTYRGWLRRIAILYASWMTIYAFLWFCIPDLSFFGIAKLIKDVLIGYYHLWYISGLLGSALLLVGMHNLPAKTLALSALVLYSIGVLIQYLGNYHYFSGSALDTAFNLHWSHRNFMFLSYPFFTIGYLINKYSIHQKISARQCALLTSTAVLALLCESAFNFYQSGREGGFDNYISLIFVCPLIFITARSATIQSSHKTISLYASGIFFIHVLVLHFMYQWLTIKATPATILAIITSFAASFVIIKVNNRYPVLL